MAYTGNADTERISLKAGSNVKTTTAQYKVGYISDDNTVSVVNTTTARVQTVGIIETYPSASSKVVSVIVNGIAKTYCNESVTAGDEVVAATNGKVAPYASGTLLTTTSYLKTIGIALETGITNQAITIFVDPKIVQTV